MQRLERVWFVEEPFTIAPFYSFEGVAHTYFVFDFQDQQPVAVSVESRRERGEGYDSIHGLFNEYELMYIWGTERDFTGRRAEVVRQRYAITDAVAATVDQPDFSQLLRCGCWRLRGLTTRAVTIRNTARNLGG